MVERKSKKVKNIILKGVISFFIIVSIPLFIFFNSRVIRIKGDSMSPYLRNNEVYLIDIKNKKYERGDIIVFNDSNKKMIKRIIAIEGDIILANNNCLFLNGEMIILDAVVPFRDGTYEVYANEFFVLGDNYEYSEDSRHFGKIKEGSIIGKLNDSR